MAETSLTINATNGSSSLTSLAATEKAVQPTSGKSTGSNSSTGAAAEAKIIETTITKEYITATLEVLPSPHVKSKEVVVLTGLSSLFDGIYYVQKAYMFMDKASFTVKMDVFKIAEASANYPANFRVYQVVPDKSRADLVQLPKPVDGSATKPTKTYVVVKGDTLSGIASRLKTTVGYIQALNSLSNPNLIYVGQKLKIPV